MAAILSKISSRCKDSLFRAAALFYSLDTNCGGAYGITLVWVVIDTNVLVAALRSSSGASFRILLAADRGDFEIAMSVPLLTEYEDVCCRADCGIQISRQAVDKVICRIAQLAVQQPIYYLWRHVLPDPKDDMVLEVAVASRATHIVTFNQRDFRQAGEFGVCVLTPSNFLAIL